MNPCNIECSICFNTIHPDDIISNKCDTCTNTICTDCEVATMRYYSIPDAFSIDCCICRSPYIKTPDKLNKAQLIKIFKASSNDDSDTIKSLEDSNDILKAKIKRMKANTYDVITNNIDLLINHISKINDAKPRQKTIKKTEIFTILIHLNELNTAIERMYNH